MSNTPENIFKNPKPMIRPIKLSNILGQPTIPINIQPHGPFRPTKILGPHGPPGPNMPVIPNIQSTHKLPIKQPPHNLPQLQPNILSNQQIDTHSTIKQYQSLLPLEIKGNNQGTIIVPPYYKPPQPTIPVAPQVNTIAQSVAKLAQSNTFIKPDVQIESSQSGLLISYTIEGSTGIHIPPRATKLIINAVAGGGCSKNNTCGGGGSGSGVNGLVVPLNSLSQGIIDVTVGVGGNHETIDGTATSIIGNASTSNFSLILNGGKGASGALGGISGNIQFFSKIILSSAINGGDCNYKNCFSSGAAGGSANMGIKGNCGGNSLFQGGLGNINSSGGGGASCFANGGTNEGQLGSGGGNSNNGGNGFASLEFYL